MVEIYITKIPKHVDEFFSKTLQDQVILLENLQSLKDCEPVEQPIITLGWWTLVLLVIGNLM
jgi:hypothetical protein